MSGKVEAELANFWTADAAATKLGEVFQASMTTPQTISDGKNEVVMINLDQYDDLLRRAGLPNMDGTPRNFYPSYMSPGRNG